MCRNLFLFLLLTQKLFSQNIVLDTLEECKSYRFRLEHDNPNYLRVTIFKNYCYNMDLVAYQMPFNHVMTLSFGSYEINKDKIIFTDTDKNYEITGILKENKLTLTNGFGPFVGKEIKLFEIERWRCFVPYRINHNFENDTVTNFKFEEGEYIGPAQQASFNFSKERFTISFEDFIFAAGTYNVSGNEIILKEKSLNIDFRLKFFDGKMYDIDMPWLLSDFITKPLKWEPPFRPPYAR